MESFPKFPSFHRDVKIHLISKLPKNRVVRLYEIGTRSLFIPTTKIILKENLISVHFLPGHGTNTFHVNKNLVPKLVR